VQLCMYVTVPYYKCGQQLCGAVMQLRMYVTVPYYKCGQQLCGAVMQLCMYICNCVEQ